MRSFLSRWPFAAKRNDLDLYERHADGWWDSDHPAFRSLRKVKDFHLELLDERWSHRMRGASVVDLGCGGGLLSLPLAERGARVVGIDLSRGSLRVATEEAARRGHDARFAQADLCRVPLTAGCADLVLLSDVLEHVEDPRSAVREAGRLLRAGGTLFVNTFDRRLAARLAAVTLAEGLGLVPRGTHDPRLFVRPSELESMCAEHSLRLDHFVWEAPALIRTAMTWTIHLKRRSSGFGYSAFFRKELS